MITLTTTIRSVHWRMQHSIWRGKTCSVNLTVPKRITASKWLTSNQSNSLHSTSQVEHSRTADWHKDSAVPYQQFRASYANISIQSSKSINAHNMSTILAEPPLSHNNSSKTYVQFYNACGEHGQMSFCGTRSRFPWTNNNNQGFSPTKAKDRLIPGKSEFSTIQKSTSKIHWILETIYLDWQNDSLHSPNYSKQHIPEPKFRSALASWKSSVKKTKL